MGWSQSLLHDQTMKKNQNQHHHPSTSSLKQVKCPRCGSTDTKFCYYNNYNKSQPRHFCKSCKRHWTKGGTLRNVPVGGGRKNKRPRMKTSPAACITNTTSMTSVATSNSSSGSEQIDPDQHQHQQLIFPQPSRLLQPTLDDISSASDHFILRELDQQFSWSWSSPFEVSSWEDPILPGSTTMTLSLTCDQLCTFSSNCSETIGNSMNLDEFDKLVSANINFPWDDLDIKLP